MLTDCIRTLNVVDEVTPERREVLLVEYQKAQDSAEHHDIVVGNVTSLWLGSAILIGFVFSGLASNEAAKFKTVLYIVIALGILLTVLVWTWAERAGRLKVQKYARCKEIEKILGMEQHRRVSRARWWQAWAYGLLIVVFLAAWVALLIDVARLDGTTTHHHRSDRVGMSARRNGA